MQVQKENLDDENLYEKVYLSKKSQDLKNKESSEVTLTPRQELKKPAFHNSNKSLHELKQHTSNSAQMKVDNSIQTLKESINTFKMKFSRSLLKEESKTMPIKQEKKRCDRVDEPIINDNAFGMSSTMNYSEASSLDSNENKLNEENELLRNENNTFEK